MHIEPEGGSVVGSWGGSGNIDVKNQISFQDIPLGKYVLHGQPNPGSEKEKSKKITVELKGGAATELTIPAK